MSWLLLPDLMCYTHLIRTESLAEDLGQVIADIAPGRNAESLLAKYTLNESLPLPDWRSHYDEEIAGLVYNYYREDFERFGYAEDSWRPEAKSASHDLSILTRQLGALENRALEAIRARNDLISSLVGTGSLRPQTLLKAFQAGSAEAPDLLRDIGVYLLQEGDWRGAKKLLSAAHILRPSGKVIRLMLARALIKGGELDQATLHADSLLNDPVIGEQARQLMSEINLP